MLAFMTYGIAKAQSDEITLNFSRDFGYSSGTGKIQGLFSMKVTSSVPLAEVVFYIDSQIIGKDNVEPYKIQFTTDDYLLGIHTLYAVVNTKDGNELKTRVVKTEFVSAKEGNRAALSIVVPILGLVLVVTILSTVIPAISSRKKGSLPLGTPRNYGLAGGTICSKCNRPFSRHVFTPNMLMGKLERCPHCGKWAIVHPFPVEKLHEAEISELESSGDLGHIKEKRDEEEINKEINDSKFQNL